MSAGATCTTTSPRARVPARDQNSGRQGVGVSLRTVCASRRWASPRAARQARGDEDEDLSHAFALGGLGGVDHKGAREILSRTASTARVVSGRVEGTARRGGRRRPNLIPARPRPGADGGGPRRRTCGCSISRARRGGGGLGETYRFDSGSEGGERDARRARRAHPRPAAARAAQRGSRCARPATRTDASDAAIVDIP